jgi:NCAIR mutase (PurE)-related protein
MMKHELRKLLDDFRNGKISEDEVLHCLTFLPFESLGFATIDHHRELRQGFPEVVLSTGKTPEQVANIAKTIVKRGHRLLVTRATNEQFNAVRKVVKNAHYNKLARTITVVSPTLGQRKGIDGRPRNQGIPDENRKGLILVITAGTSDIPVAEEAGVTAEIMGNHVERVYDVGVAGIHRLFAHINLIRRAAVVIVVAGMEGALASVVGGLVDVPVIAVPTSIGYGASFQGLSALLGMLNSCAAGVTVVNIDNGFGAGFAASLMNRD